jgi:tetratricopeptide (TPR) repeat protein
MQKHTSLQHYISLILLVIFWLNGTVANAQKISAKDSLYVVSLYLKSTAEPNPEIALQYADSMISFSTQKKFLRGNAWAYKQKARLYSFMKQTPQALYNIDKGITFAARGRYYKELINQLIFSSQIRNEYAFFDRAFSDVTKAIDIAAKIKDTTWLGKSYTQLGRCYYAKEDFKKAMEYDEKALALFRKSHDVESLRETLTALGTANIDAKNFQKGLAQLKEVETGNPEIPITPYRLPQLYGNIGWCYHRMGKEDLALQYYNMAFESIRQLGSNDNLIVAEVVLNDNMGSLYLGQGKYELAEQYLTKALAGAMKVKTPDDFRTIYGHLSELYKHKKQYKKALEYQILQQQYADSVMSQEKMEALENLSVKFQTREVEDKNTLLEKENALQKAQAEQEKSHRNLILYVSIAIVLFLLTAIIFGYYYFRQKSIIDANKASELRRKMLLTQMTPHFIFNSIDNIQSLIYGKQDKEAVNYLTKFSKLTRQILENSNENYITLEEELEMIRNYIGIQQLLYNNTFDCKIEVDESINPESILIPPMLTQPFIENAIKHGFKNGTQKGFIDIHFTLRGKELYFEITDNGVGFDTINADKTTKSMAMKITTERLQDISKKDFDLHKENTVDEKNNISGAKVSFGIPYIYEN